MTEPAAENGVSRRVLLRGGAAAGMVFGLAACGAAAQNTPPSVQQLPPTPQVSSSAAPSAVPPVTPPSAAGPSGPPVPGGPATELVSAHTGRPEVALTFHGSGSNTLDRKVL